jgi:hypothetical protein
VLEVKKFIGYWSSANWIITGPASYPAFLITDDWIQVEVAPGNTFELKHNYEEVTEETARYIAKLLGVFWTR